MNMITVTPTISTSAYANGDAIGGKLTFNGTPFESGLIHSVTLIDKSKQNASIDLVLLDQDFTPTGDNAAFTVQSGDLSKLLMAVNIPSTAYRDLGANATIATVSNLSIPFKIADTAQLSTLFGQLVSRGTPTYGTTSSLTLKLGVLSYA